MLQKGAVRLRAPEPEDLDFLFDTENDHRWWHLSGTLLPFSRFDLEQYLFTADKDIFAHKQARFIIDYRLQPAGMIDLFDFEPLHKRAGVGIMVSEEFRGRGVGAQALQLLIEYAFGPLQLHQLFCNIEAENEQSLKLFQKAGFEKRCLKKEWNFKNGIPVDEWFLQLLNKEQA